MRVMLAVVALAACDRLYSASSSHHDAGDDDGNVGGAPPRCSPMTMIAGDFHNASIFDSGWWSATSSPPAGFSSTGPSVVTAVFPAGTSNGRTVLTSHAFLDLRGSSFTIAVGPASMPVNGSIVVALTDITQANSMQIELSGTMLRIKRVDDAVPETLMTLPYDPTTQHVWRFACPAEMLMWKTSQDSTGFDTLYSVPRPVWATYLRPTITVDRPTSLNELDVTFGQINSDASTGEGCPIAELADDFAGTVLGDLWYKRIEPVGIGSIDVDSRQLLATMNGGGNGTAVVVSAKVYDLRDASTKVNLASPSTTTGETARFGALLMNGDSVELRQDVGAYEAVRGGLSTKTVTGPAPPWWRLRAAGTTLVWETSDDGSTWNALATATDVPGVDRVQLVIGMDQMIGGGMAASARFDNVNVPP